MPAMRLAVNVVWKSIALTVAGVVAGFVLILIVVYVTGGSIGDPGPAY